MKVLLVPDRPGWAFDNRAKDLLSFRFRKIKCRIKYARDVTENDQHRYSLIYPMSLSIARTLNQKGIPLHRMASAITSIRVFEKHRTKHGFDPEFLQFVTQLRGINTWSREIMNIFKKHCPIYFTRIGINEKLFSPAEKKRDNRKFTVGWVGNIENKKYRELKGYDLVRNAVKGMDVRLTIRTLNHHYVPRNKMASFYQRLDCFICSSRSEGLPNPLLEAAACGVPIITTKVGIVPDLVKHRENGIIIPRTAKAIRREIKYLMRHPREARRMGRKMRKRIVKRWTWETCKSDWEKFFRSVHHDKKGG